MNKQSLEVKWSNKPNCIKTKCYVVMLALFLSVLSGWWVEQALVSDNPAKLANYLRRFYARYDNIDYAY